MEEIRGRKALVTTRRHMGPLREIRKTLAEHYGETRAYYGFEHPDFYDGDLRRLFSESPEHAGNLSAATFLRRVRRELRGVVAQWTGEYRYTINQVLGEMIERCSDLELRLQRGEDVTKRDAMVMLTVQVMNYLHSGRHRVAL